MRFAISLALLAVAASQAPAGISNSLMDVTPDGKRLLVANPDSGTVTVIDIATAKAVREIAVGAKPEGVTWIGKGSLAVVTVFEEDRIVFIDVEAGRIVKKLDVADEPYGIVSNRAGTRAFVTHDYLGLVSIVDLVEQKVISTTAVAPFLRGIALAPDEKRLFVTEFHTARLHSLRLGDDGVLIHEDVWASGAQDNLCRHVLIHPLLPRAYLSHIRSRTEVAHGAGSIFPHLSVCKLTSDTGGKRRTSIALDTFNGVRVVTNPWESALSPDGSRLYTIYAGTNDMNLSRVLNDDYQEIDRIGNVINVGKNPRAVRVSPDGGTVFVYNAMDFNVSFHDASTLRKRATVEACKPPKSPEWVQGKILFNTALRPMTSQLWIACSSCHPDGRQDARVWQNPEGLRKTTSLYGMAHTHPLHWSADRDEVQDFEFTIRSKLMRGRGLFEGKLLAKEGYKKVELEQSLSGKSKDLDALAIYSNSFEPTLSPHIPAPGKLSLEAQRGRKLFTSEAVGCATCHGGPYYTDSNLKKPYKLHNVGTGADDPSEKMSPEYDTPSLLGVYRTAPYLHHGKAATLEEVLTRCNKDDRHGKTSQLSASDIKDLVAFLKSLPFEQPPLTTPNTVPHRFSPANKSDASEN